MQTGCGPDCGGLGALCMPDAAAAALALLTAARALARLAATALARGSTPGGAAAPNLGGGSSSEGSIRAAADCGRGAGAGLGSFLPAADGFLGGGFHACSSASVVCLGSGPPAANAGIIAISSSPAALRVGTHMGPSFFTLGRMACKPAQCLVSSVPCAAYTDPPGCSPAPREGGGLQHMAGYSV